MPFWKATYCYNPVICLHIVSIGGVHNWQMARVQASETNHRISPSEPKPGPNCWSIGVLTGACLHEMYFRFLIESGAL
jgi:hypothetical protein